MLLFREEMPSFHILAHKIGHYQSVFTIGILSLNTSLHYEILATHGRLAIAYLISGHTDIALHTDTHRYERLCI